MRIAPILLAVAIPFWPFAVIAADAPASSASGTKPIDAHALYEKKCGGCHTKHASGLAQRSLKLDAEKNAVTNAGVRVDKLLAGHQKTALSEAEIRALSDQFALMLGTGFVFQKKCAGCHSTGLDFARLYLTIKDGELISRVHDTPVAKLLETHARLTETQLKTVVDMLRRHVESK